MYFKFLQRICDAKEPPCAADAFNQRFRKFLRLLPAWNGLSTGTALVRRQLTAYNCVMAHAFRVQADPGRPRDFAAAGQIWMLPRTKNAA